MRMKRATNELTRQLLFGAIADDYTGASDLASRLHEQGAPTLQVFGLQPDDFIDDLRDRWPAIVISLKSRSVPPAEARAWSLRALAQLRRLEARQIQFKYCSTFDSTAEGNIGPVTSSRACRRCAPSAIRIWRSR